jgi:hypothetical protein
MMSSAIVQKPFRVCTAALIHRDVIHFQKDHELCLGGKIESAPGTLDMGVLDTLAFQDEYATLAS